MIHELSNTKREGILFATSEHLNVLSDKEISEGDILNFPSYSNVFFHSYKSPQINVSCIAILEERPSCCEWKNGNPPIWRKIKYAIVNAA
jgi:hypothetical protein